MDEAITLLDSMLQGDRTRHVTVVNAVVAIWCERDPTFRDLVATADLRLCDGMGFMYASRILGQPFPEMLSGPLLMDRLIAHAASHGYPVYFLGSTRHVVTEAVRRFRNSYPALQVAGLRDGFFSLEEEPLVVEGIQGSGARLLLVAMGSPREESFIRRNQGCLGVPLVLDVGGAFEVAAGLRRLAPRWMRLVGVEWAYRVAQEPRRLWKRYAVTLPVFVWRVASLSARRWSRRAAGSAAERRSA